VEGMTSKTKLDDKRNLQIKRIAHAVLKRACPSAIVLMRVVDEPNM
jgi:hypothetical protein